MLNDSLLFPPISPFFRGAFTPPLKVMRLYPKMSPRVINFRPPTPSSTAHQQQRHATLPHSPPSTRPGFNGAAVWSFWLPGRHQYSQCHVPRSIRDAHDDYGDFSLLFTFAIPASLTGVTSSFGLLYSIRVVHRVSRYFPICLQLSSITHNEILFSYLLSIRWYVVCGGKKAIPDLLQGRHDVHGLTFLVREVCETTFGHSLFAR